jgi:hypothetical protein
MINDFIIIDALFFSLFYGYKARSIVDESDKKGHPEG